MTTFQPTQRLWQSSTWPCFFLASFLVWLNSPAPAAQPARLVENSTSPVEPRERMPHDEKSAPDSTGDSMIVVIGAAGSPEFEGEFESWAEGWQQLASKHNWTLSLIHRPSDAETTVHDQLRSSIDQHRDETGRLWIVMLGHGTYANGVAKFNLIGPDVSSSELKDWLKPLRSDVVLVNCSSASAPFLPELSGENRVIITATRSGSESNYSRFGKYLAQSLNDLSADIDHDESVSLLEAFLAASSKTENFYLTESRLATEHALLEDNHDGVGTSGDFYRGIRPTKSGKDGKPVDGLVASRIILNSAPTAVQFPRELAEQRAALEQSLDQLRLQKSQLAANDYYDELESLLLKLAGLYDSAERLSQDR